jgi:nucleotide-binding universal stress UspA family protein
MRKLQSILLATDLRPASQEALKAAAQLASAFGSRVTLLHVLEPLPGWPVALHQEQQQVAGPLQEIAQQLAARKVQVTESSIVTGSPGDVVVRKAQEIDADLIVMGAGERSRFDRFSAGPVAQAVIEHAPQPVLAVRPGEPALEFQKILCPVDMSEASGRGLRNAIRLARALRGELIILTVVPEVNWLTAAAETGQLAGAKTEYESKWRHELERFLVGIPTHDVKAKKEVRHGAPRQQIIAAVKDHQADVIIMGATGHTGLVRVLLGSTTRRVLEQLPCSLLTVKEEDVVEELFEGEVRLIKLLMAEGRALLCCGSYEAALVKFRQVLGYDPFHVGATIGLVEAHEKLGHHDLARYHRRRAENLQEKS